MSDQVLERQGAAVIPRDLAPAPVKTARLSRRKLLLAATALVIATGGSWYGYDWWTIGRFIESTDDAYVGGDITVIAPQVSGFITKLAIADNQTVKAGQLLLQIDDRDYRAALAKADAAVAMQQASLANIAATRRLQESTIAQAQADLITTNAETIRTKEDTDRYQSLSKDQWASLQRYQQANATYTEAVGADAKAHAGLEAARRRLDVIDTESQQAQASLAASIADRDTARLNLGYTSLRSPVDGVVGNRSAQLGAFAAIGAQLLSVIPAHDLWVDANFKESQLARMKAGQPVNITADVLPGEVFHGHVVSLAPATGAEFSVLPAENATGNFTKIVQRVPVRIRLDDGASELGRLRPGLSVTASVVERDRDAPSQ
ncbi:HlyD family secretion protein [Acidisoma sp. L85]|jgi:membrane fusion protein (multidrug efflux system)|uniref:HlyD family secretion protein n=1 Tax=Acidisoma sp. L85 TaxID=1641850 RepID=UPI00131C6B04|nr:HlyD family secretion protein [Acidisoma sp. L85]